MIFAPLLVKWTIGLGLDEPKIVHMSTSFQTPTAIASSLTTSAGTPGSASTLAREMDRLGALVADAADHAGAGLPGQDCVHEAAERLLAAAQSQGLAPTLVRPTGLGTVLLARWVGRLAQQTAGHDVPVGPGVPAAVDQAVAALGGRTTTLAAARR